MHLSRWLPSLLLAAPLVHAACSGCDRRAAESLEIGFGEDDYIPLDEVDGAWELVYGPQGGWHVPIAVEATGLDASQIITVDMVGWVDGGRLAELTGAWQQLRCDTEADALQAWDMILEFDRSLEPSSCPLHEAPLEVQVTLTDWRGDAVEGRAQGRIVDPIHDDICTGDDAG